MHLEKTCINKLFKTLLSSILLLSLTVTFTRTIAYGDTMTDIISTESEIAQLIEKVDLAQDEYNAAQDAYAAAEAKMNENQQRIDEIEEQLRPYKESLGEILKWQYQNFPETALNIMTGADTLTEFLAYYEYLSVMQDSKIETINKISEGEDELIRENEALQEEQVAMELAKQEQAAIKEAAQADIDELNRKLDGLREDQKEYLGYKGTAGGGAAYEPPVGGTPLDYALSRVGCPYVWGASGSNSFDCSGLIMWAYSQSRGLGLPHNSEAQKNAGTVIPISEAQPGDVLWKPGHVGMFISHNKDANGNLTGGYTFVHAPHSGAFVRIQGSDSYHSFVCAIRY